MDNPPKDDNKEDAPLFLGSDLAKSKPESSVPPPSEGKKAEMEQPAAPAPSLREKLSGKFSLKSKHSYKDKLKEVLSSEDDAPAELAQWSKKSFSSAPDVDDYVAAAAPRGGANETQVRPSKLKTFIRRRPMLTMVVLLIAFSIFAIDVLVLTRRLDVGKLRAIAFGGDARPKIPVARFDGRGSGLSLLEQGIYGDGGPTDSVTASAISGANQLATGCTSRGCRMGSGAS